MVILDAIQMGPYKLILRDGMTGYYTENEAVGALKNGTRVMKVKSEPSDGTVDGTPGRVLGSMSEPGIFAGAVCYFIEWSNRPGYAVMCMGFKVEAAN